MLLYEGKAKKIFSTENKNEVLVYFKDDATAFNGEKKSQIEDKGVLNNFITTQIYEMLHQKGVQTHFIKKVSDREQLVKKVEIIPLEVIVRNRVAGSMAKRYGLEEGVVLQKPALELCLKDDALGDPFINDSLVLSLGLATEKELQMIQQQALLINNILIPFCQSLHILLIDFKLEFGRYENQVLLADEITPDTCRFWDSRTMEKLDKDRFRRDLGQVKEAYQNIAQRLGG